MQSVHIAETSTDKVPNSSPTAASASSDLCAPQFLSTAMCSNLGFQHLP